VDGVNVRLRARERTTVRLSFRSTPTRVLVILPTIVAVEQIASRRRLHPRWVPMMAWGYLQYRLAGSYRITNGGGPPGMSQGYPEALVESGVYRWTRNPMYLGHLIFAAGLAATTRSPVAAAAFGGLVPWFRRRVRRDEQRLALLFGTPYERYTGRVPRWLPGTPAVQVAQPETTKEAP
jgi:protein-S-isoprenylcysteine O-methyltransferase Ste14